MLDKFWAAEQAAASAAPDDAAPAAQIEECSPGTVGEELRFRLRLVLDPLTTVAVGGFIDRVDRSASGDLEVIDYKTGRAATGVEADSSLQLSLYALACRDALRLGRPQRVTLYFVEHGVRISADRSDAALEGVRADLVGRAREIRASRFGPTPGTRACGWCDFGSMCDAAAREPAAGSQPIS
jgi:RecB family exonuclease